MISAKDTQSRYVLMNVQQARLYGTTPEHAIGRTAGEADDLGVRGLRLEDEGGEIGGVVGVAVASVWDLYWHQTHPLEMGASMNMMSLPPHQLILAGFTVGLIGSLALLVRRPQPAVPGGRLHSKPDELGGPVRR